MEDKKIKEARDLIGDEQFEADIAELRAIKEEKIRRMERETYRYYEPNGKCEEFINAVGEGNNFIVLFSAANGVGKSCAGTNIVANFLFPGKNDWFKAPLFQNFPYPKRGRIVSDPGNIPNIVKSLETWLPKGKYRATKGGKDYLSKWDAGDWHFDIMSYEQDPKDFEAETLGFVWFDEPPTMAIFLASVARLRMGGVIFITATMLKGSAWLYDKLVAGEMEVEGIDGEKIVRKVAHIEAGVEDACFSPDNQILTRNGWRYFDDVEKDELVATYNIPERKLEYQPITAKINKLYKGQLLDFGLGIKATPDHRMVVLNEWGGDKNRKRRVGDLRIEIKELDKLYRGLRLPAYFENVSDNNDGQKKIFGRFDEGDWAEFMGWYLSEGCVTGVNGNPRIGKYQIYISQNRGDKKEQIKRLISKMGLPLHERKDDVWFTDREIHQHLLPLGNKYQKYIPRYVFNFSNNSLTRMWQSLLAGDGDGKYRYVTTSSRLADDVQELVLRLGLPASLRKWKGFRKEQREIYCVRTGIKNNYYISKRPTIIDFEGNVQCVAVKNGTIVVRNDKEKYPVIVGNCIQHGVRGHLEHENIMQMIAEYPEDEREARVYGRFQHLAGLIFKSFKKEVHIIPPFQINLQDFVVVEALDPHPRTPDAVMWIAIDRKGRKIIVDELYVKPQNGSEELAQLIKEKAEKYRVITRIGDPSGWNNDQHKDDTRGICERLADYGLDYIPATKNREAADKRVQDALAYIRIPTGEFIKAPELFVFETCRRTIWELQHYRWDEWTGKMADKRDIKEKPVDKDDHQIENLGRILLREPYFMELQASTFIGESDLDKDDPYD